MIFLAATPFTASSAASLDAVTVQDNVSHLTHIVGGLCGAILGFAMRK